MQHFEENLGKSRRSVVVVSSVDRLLTISDLAERTGVPPATLRSWESRYGFPRPIRLAGGHRRYAQRDVDAGLEVLGFGWLWVHPWLLCDHQAPARGPPGPPRQLCARGVGGPPSPAGSFGPWPTAGMPSATSTPFWRCCGSAGPGSRSRRRYGAR